MDGCFDIKYKQYYVQHTARECETQQHWRLKIIKCNIPDVYVCYKTDLIDFSAKRTYQIPPFHAYNWV